ncbi:hypothetical protein BOTBODRAFT_39349 [Botryobasidium botryosum FD-172 SS1]|uniref:Uncharacterized protein n=1 Tax=Botryobasidium botryosum (strain FD-172 SS1) TaxID=930990 RepID=A0A067LU61_BOTB1|nr:hypothetical protein BOTBODRAFT_39349 [Botryobasidium botryosum FD-172 SS1]
MSRGIYPALGVTTPFDPTYKLVTSHFVSPTVLAAFRLALAVYSLVTLIIYLIYDSVTLHDGETFLSYFTHLSYIGLCAYFFASGVQTFFFARSLKRHYQSYPTGADTYPLQKWPRFLQFLHSLLFSTISTFPILVTIVFWALLSDPTTLGTPFNAWENISFHAMNSGFVVLEIFLGRMGPSPWSHLPFLVLMLAGYLGVAYVTHATQGFYTYSFLNPAHGGGRLAGYIIGILVAELIIFAIVWVVCWLRDRPFRNRPYMAGISSEAVDMAEKAETPSPV